MIAGRIHNLAPSIEAIRSTGRKICLTGFTNIGRDFWGPAKRVVRERVCRVYRERESLA